MHRTYYYNESTGESSTTVVYTTAWQRKASVTFTPEANSTYVFLASWMSSAKSTGNISIGRTIIDGDATYGLDLVAHKDSSDYRTAGSVFYKTFGSSPTSTTVAIDYASYTSGLSAYIKEARIIAIKLETGDQYASQTTEQTTTSTSYTPALTLDLTHTSNADYYVFAGYLSRSYSESNSHRISTRLFAVNSVGGDVSLAEQIITPKEGSDIESVATAAYLETDTANTTDIRVDFATSTGIYTAGVDNIFIVALRAGNFNHSAYIETTTPVSTSSTGWSDVLGDTFSTFDDDFKHLFFGYASVKGSTTSYSSYTRFTHDSVVKGGENTREPTSSSDIYGVFHISEATVSSTIDIALEHRSESIIHDTDTYGTVGMIQLEAGAYTYYNRAKANIKTTNTKLNTARGFILAVYSKTNSVKARITDTYENGPPVFDVVYTGDILPTAETPSWKIYGTIGTEEIVSGAVHGVVASASQGRYAKDITWNPPDFNNRVGTRIDFRAKVSGCVGGVYDDFCVYFIDGAYYVKLNLTDIEVGIKSGYLVEGDQSYAIDATSWHNYSFRIQGKKVTVYVDGVLRIVGTANNTAPGSYAVSFGSATSSDGTSREWWVDSLAYGQYPGGDYARARIYRPNNTVANYVKSMIVVYYYISVPVDVVAAIFLQNVTKANSVRAAIWRPNQTQTNTVKGNIYDLKLQDNKAKAYLSATTTRSLDTRANVKAPQEKANKASGYIYVSGFEVNKAVARISFAGYTAVNTASGKVEVSHPVENTVKAIIAVTYTNNVVSIGKIIGYVSQNNAVRASIPGLETNQSVVASISKYPFKKQYEYRVYDGINYVTSWSIEVISQPTFRMVINGGPGEMVVRLARPFDDFGEEWDIKLFNNVEVWCYDVDEPDGVLIYSGFISGYRPVIAKHSEYLEVTLLHRVAEMSNIMLRDGSDNTTILQSSTDPSNMFKNIIDYYRADGGVINYTASSVEDTGNTVTYNFKAYTVKEALDKVIELTPEKWYWLIDSGNTAYLKESNMLEAAHQFIIGEDIIDMETWRRGEDIINTVYFFGADQGDGTNYYWKYTNAGSVSAYGIHAYKYVDGRVSVGETADWMVERLINERKDPEIRTTITIADNNGKNPERGYDIESIKPGDTMRISNIKMGTKTLTLWDQFEWDVDVWDQTLAYAAADVIQILSVEYSPNAVRIEASSRLPEITKRIEDVKRSWQSSVTETTADAPTAR